MINDIPGQGRLAGIDYGTVRVGIAVTDPERRLASPYENYTRRGVTADAHYFRELATQERIVGFIVGLPVHLSGSESQKSLEAREFGRWLHHLTGVPVEFHDERFSSSQAAEILGGAALTRKQRKKRLDMLAAQILLTSYLESSHLKSSTGGQQPGALDDCAEFPGRKWQNDGGAE